MKPLHSTLLAGLALAWPILSAAHVSADTLLPTADTFSTATLDKSVPPNITKETIAGTSGKSGTMFIAKNHHAFIQFNAKNQLTAEGITAGDIVSARLTIFFPSVVKAGAIDLHLATSIWDETFKGTLAAPSFGAAIASLPANLVVAKKFATFDVTPTVLAWLNGSAPDNGFVLEASDLLANVTIGSKEGPGSGYPATLEIETSVPSNLTQIGQDPNTGNIGIGTGTPVKPLDVALSAGTVKAGTDSVDGSLSLRLSNLTQNGNSSNPNVVGIGFGATDTRQAIVGGTFGSDFLEFFTNGDMTHPKLTIDANGAVIIPGTLVNTGVSTFTGGLTLANSTNALTVNGPTTYNGHLTMGPFGPDALATINQTAALNVGTSSTYSLEVNGLPGTGVGLIGLGVDSAGAHLTTFSEFVPTFPFSATLPLFLNDNGGNTIINPGSGSVGIGTSGPGAKLDVRGDIKLGPNGQFQATSGEEKLRIVRGVVVGTVVAAGSGYTVTHPSTGKYTVTFTTAFADSPVVTVNAVTQTPVRIASVSANNPGSIDLSFKTADSLDNDTSAFEFIVVGPR